MSAALCKATMKCVPSHENRWLSIKFTLTSAYAIKSKAGVTCPEVEPNAYDEAVCRSEASQCLQVEVFATPTLEVAAAAAHIIANPGGGASA